ncbi:MAG: hypothetical protein FWE42_07785 [Defluviitaleaceae bacterium]|nr:hypothetical protein [Defluviitaleaceae bacterium]
MMNWRKIAVTGLVAGMIAFTGCSSNMPETNQGNRNGQRVVDSVNHRTDSYGITRGRTNTTRRVDGTRGTRHMNRGFRRAARHDGVNHGLGRTTPGVRHHGNVNSGINRTPNRSVNTHSRHNTTHGRVGHTFGYDAYGYMQGLEHDGGYDLGRPAGNGINRVATPNPQKRTNINNRVVRSAPGASTARVNHGAKSAVTPKPATSVTRSATPKTAANVTRSTTPKPAANVTRNAAPKTTTNVTRSTTPKPATNVTRNTAPKTTTNVTRNTAPKTATKVTRNAAPKPATNVTRNTAPKTTNITRNTQPTRGTQRGLSAASRNTASPRRISRGYRPTPNIPQELVKHSAIVQHKEQVANVRAGANRSARRTAAARPSARRSDRAQALNINAGFHHMQNITQPTRETSRGITRNTNSNTNVQNRATRRAASANARRHDQYVNQRGVNTANTAVNHNIINSDFNNQYSNNNVYRNLSNEAAFTNYNEYDTTVVASATNEGDYAFFKRNKTDINNETPAPTPPNTDGAVNPTSEPVVTPIPPATMDDTYDTDDMTDNIHDIDDKSDDVQSRYDSSQLKPIKTDGKPAPVRRAAQRAMK